MIELNIQIISLIFSFLYGFLFYILLNLNYRFLTSSNLFVKILSSFLFVLLNTFIYFAILVYINKGYIHMYFLLSILMGYFFCKPIYKWFVNKIGVCYTTFKSS